jgi:hypothetical protein
MAVEYYASGRMGGLRLRPPKTRSGRTKIKSREHRALFTPTLSGNRLELHDWLGCSRRQAAIIGAALTGGLKTVEDISYLTNLLGSIARRAYSTRRFDYLDLATQLLAALPESDSTRNAVSFYRGLFARQRRDAATARRHFEEVVEQASPNYRIRALQCLCALSIDVGDADSANRFYTTAALATVKTDPVTLFETHRMTALMRVHYGDHRGALRDLKRLLPFGRELGRYHPERYFDLLNSIAVELGEVGRFEEAKAVASVAVGSPFAHAFPEWIETAQEIDAKQLDRKPYLVAVDWPLQPDASSRNKSRRARPDARRIIRRRFRRQPSLLQRAIRLRSEGYTTYCPTPRSDAGVLSRIYRSVAPRSPPRPI